MNLVTACGCCNGSKADRTPEEAGMPLVYLPYVPSRFEDFLLEGRHIRADVHEWLAARLPKGSRLSWKARALKSLLAEGERSQVGVRMQPARRCAASGFVRRCCTCRACRKQPMQVIDGLHRKVPGSTPG